MGSTSSKLDKDKSLQLCHERKQLTRQILKGRCSLAAAHISYIQSLRRTGIALGRIVETEIPAHSSLFTSTSTKSDSMIPEDKTFCHLTFSSQSPQTTEAHSPLITSPSPKPLHIDHMKTQGKIMRSIEKRLPQEVTLTLSSASASPTNLTSRSFNDLRPPSPSPETPPWDYFDLFHPIDHQYSLIDNRTWKHDLDNVDEIQLLREEEGIPDLEEEGGKSFLSQRSKCLGSNDEFYDSSSIPSVVSFGNKSVALDSTSSTTSAAFSLSIKNAIEEINQQKENLLDDKKKASGSSRDPQMTSVLKEQNEVTNDVKVADNDLSREDRIQNVNHLAKGFLSSLEQMEHLLTKTSDCGIEVLGMLEAYKLCCHPLVTKRKALRSKVPMCLPFLSCLRFLGSDVHPAQGSSPSMVSLGSLKNDMESLRSNILASFCMKSGSHSSTLDRIFAWERKLYNEVKASCSIRKKFDAKCKLLRHQEYKAASTLKIDKTRAAIKELHSEIRITIHRIDSVSKKIEELRDRELYPQLEELIEGLCRMWKNMNETHKVQFNIMRMACNDESSNFITSEFLHQISIQLEQELNSLFSNFIKWIDAYRFYVQSIYNWLIKCVVPIHQKARRKRKIQFSPGRYLPPPIFIMCRNWLRGIDSLSTQEFIEITKKLICEVARLVPIKEKKKQSKHFLSLSLPWNINGRRIEDYEKINEELHLVLNLDGLQSGLVDLFGWFQIYSECTFKMYENLQESIKTAELTYSRAAKG